MLLAQRLERLRQRRGQGQKVPGTPEGLHSWARMVCGQLQRGHPGKLLLPVGKLRVQHLSLQPLLLPVGKVRILYGERREWRWLSSRKSAHRARPIPARTPRETSRQRRYDASSGATRAPRRRAAQGWHVSKVPAPDRTAAGLLPAPACAPALPAHVGTVLQVYDRHRKACGRPNDLERLAGNVGKSCAQDFVTPDDFLKALLQGRHLQGAAQTYRFQQVIGMATEP